MDYGRILGRAFQITIHHRALWLYGFLLALFGGGGGGGGGGGSNVNYQVPAPGATPGAPPMPPGLPGDLGVLPQIPTGAWATAAVAVACVVFFLIIAAVAIQNISRSALIGMADEVERTGGTSVGSGWGFGWSRFAWRNFLINFVVGLGVAVLAAIIAALIIGVIALFGVGLGATSGQMNETTGLGVVALVCLALLCVVPLFIALAVLVGSVLSLSQRHVVLRDAGVFESLSAGWSLFRAHWRSLLVLLIILFLIGLGWTIVVGGLALVLGLGLAGLPGIVVGLLTERTWAGVLAALPGFIFLLISLSLLGALWATFHETIWTLVYRDLTGLGGPAQRMAPAPVPPPFRVE